MSNELDDSAEPTPTEVEEGQQTKCVGDLAHYEVVSPLMTSWGYGLEPPEDWRCWGMYLVRNASAARTAAVRDEAFSEWVTEARGDNCPPFKGLEVTRTRCEHGVCWGCHATEESSGCEQCDDESERHFQEEMEKAEGMSRAWKMKLAAAEHRIEELTAERDARDVVIDYGDERIAALTAERDDNRKWRDENREWAERTESTVAVLSAQVEAYRGLETAARECASHCEYGQQSMDTKRQWCLTHSEWTPCPFADLRAALAALSDKEEE